MSSENEKQPRRIMSANSYNINSSNNEYSQTYSQEQNTQIPYDVKNRFNWGAFFLSWIWGLGNNTFITFLIFVTILVGWIPIFGFLVSLGLCIWFGIKGNEWAWQNKRFASIYAFHEYQKKWAIAGIILFAITIILSIIGIVAILALPSMISGTAEQQNITAQLKSQNTLYEIVKMNEVNEEKCELSSNGLAACFAKHMNTKNLNGNVIESRDGTVWTFEGNRRCEKYGDCKVRVNSSNKSTGREILNVPLYVDNKGLLYVKEEDLFTYDKNLSSYDEDYNKKMEKIDQDLKKLEEELKKYENTK